jgi:hypothetical protein
VYSLIPHLILIYSVIPAMRHISGRTDRRHLHYAFISCTFNNERLKSPLSFLYHRSPRRATAATSLTGVSCVLSKRCDACGRWTKAAAGFFSGSKYARGPWHVWAMFIASNPVSFGVYWSCAGYYRNARSFVLQKRKIAFRSLFYFC